MSDKDIIPEKVQEAIFNVVLQRPENHQCADCLNKSPTWASIEFGVFLCIGCSGIHRQLGPHITRVKSSKLDKWERKQIEIMVSVGNTLANDYYEYKLPKNFKRLDSNANPEEFSRFVKDKYIRKQFAPPNYSTPVEDFLNNKKNGLVVDLSFAKPKVVTSMQQTNKIQRETTPVVRKKSLSIENSLGESSQKQVPNQKPQGSPSQPDNQLDFLSGGDNFTSNNTQNNNTNSSPNQNNNTQNQAAKPTSAFEFDFSAIQTSQGPTQTQTQPQVQQQNQFQGQNQFQNQAQPSNPPQQQQQQQQQQAQPENKVPDINKLYQQSSMYNNAYGMNPMNTMNPMMMNNGFNNQFGNGQQANGMYQNNMYAQNNQAWNQNQVQGQWNGNMGMQAPVNNMMPQQMYQNNFNQNGGQGFMQNNMYMQQQQVQQFPQQQFNPQMQNNGFAGQNMNFVQNAPAKFY